jgi:hypothetical protein
LLKLDRGAPSPLLGEVEAAMSTSGPISEEHPVFDLACLSREKRQEMYGEVLKKGGRMTPTQVKDELEQRGMTFAFVGQDMAAMRTMACIQIEGRGQYRWNSNFASVSETRKAKRQRSI